MEDILQQVKKIHLIGIGGAGMSGLALLLQDRGFLVQGSDIQRNSKTKKLEERGIRVYIGHKKENIDSKIDWEQQDKVSAASSRKVLDEILDLAGIQNRWISTFEDVDLRDPKFIRRILLNAEYNGAPISINKIKDMGTEWRKVRVKDTEIGFDKTLRSLVQYFNGFSHWKDYPQYSLDHVVVKMKKGRVNQSTLNEILEFAGLLIPNTRRRI
jgi:hypothetical protein